MVHVNFVSFVVFSTTVAVVLQNTVYTRVQVERVYKSNPIFEAKNTTFLEKFDFLVFIS